MTRLHIIIVTLTVSCGTILCLGERAFSHQRGQINHLRDQIRVNEQRLTAQRHDLSASEQDLSLAQVQLSALTPSEELAQGSESRYALAMAWIGRVRHVKQLFEANPDHRVPYLRLLTNEDWLRATLRMKFDNAMSDRNALGALRMAAARLYQAPLTRALTRYAHANNDVQPAGVFAVAPYFDDPVDSEGLSQFDIVVANGAPWMLSLKRGPDPGNYGSMLAAPKR